MATWSKAWTENRGKVKVKMTFFKRLEDIHTETDHEWMILNELFKLWWHGVNVWHVAEDTRCCFPWWCVCYIAHHSTAQHLHHFIESYTVAAVCWGFSPLTAKLLNLSWIYCISWKNITYDGKDKRAIHAIKKCKVKRWVFFKKQTGHTRYIYMCLLHLGTAASLVLAFVGSK